MTEITNNNNRDFWRKKCVRVKIEDRESRRERTTACTCDAVWASVFEKTDAHIEHHHTD